MSNYHIIELIDTFAAHLSLQVTMYVAIVEAVQAKIQLNPQLQTQLKINMYKERRNKGYILREAQIHQLKPQLQTQVMMTTNKERIKRDIMLIFLSIKDLIFN